jgi:mannitol-specific phosphotransferase system IIBC component
MRMTAMVFWNVKVVLCPVTTILEEPAVFIFYDNARKKAFFSVPL